MIPGNSRCLTRRQFGKSLFHTALGVSALSFLPGEVNSLLPPQEKSRVALVQSERLKRLNDVLSKENAVYWLTEAMLKLTGKASGAEAWKSLFSPHERIGIKLSCLPGKMLSSSVGLVMAIVDGLLSAGINENNIYIWERSERELENAGFKIKREGVKVLGTDSAGMNFSGSDGYLDNIEFAGSVGTRFSWIMEKVDALINVPVLKDHDLSGISVGMKNFYGAIFNPNKYHRNNCDPYIAELYSHRMIKNKVRLIVCDASRVQVNNGPAFFPKYAWEYGALLVSRDPVALDMAGWHIIEAGRRKFNLNSLKEVGREPKYIFTAAKMGLGNMNFTLI